MNRFIILVIKKKISFVKFYYFLNNRKKMNILNVLLYVDCEIVQGFNSNNFSKYLVEIYGDRCILVLKF